MVSAVPAPPPRRRTVVLGGVVVAVVAGVGGLIWYTTARPAADREDGLRLARARDFAAAEPFLAKAYGRNPTDLEVVEVLARGYAAADNPKAESLLTRWVELAPNQPDPLRARMTYHHKHKDGRAYSDARALSDLDPADAKARRTAMNHAFSYGRFAEAEGLSREGLKQQPADTHLRTILAEARLAQGDRDGAAAVLDALIKDHPRLTGPLLARATLHEAAGEPARAAPLLRTVFESDPQQRRAAGYQLAVVLDQTGQAAEAAKVRAEVSRLQEVEIASEAAKTQPDNFDLHVRLAEQLLAAGHTADGLRFLNDVLARSPQFGPAHRALAEHYAKAGDPDRAADHRRSAGP